MDAASAAELLARMFGEGHGLACRLDNNVVELPEARLRIAVDIPDLQPNGVVVRMPIGVNHPAWGEVFAWDQAVGVGGEDRHPVVAAAYDWLHYVFPVFAAYAMPGHGLAANVHTETRFDGRRAAKIHYGPIAIRDFGGLTETTQQAAADRSPTMVVAERLFTGYALPDRPLWWYTFAARMPSGPIEEVTLVNGDGGDSLKGISDHLPWEGHGSVKSWALIAPDQDAVIQQVPIG
ncbi:hypothetical protein [Actinoallomurus rhizosphaericola]|uniref:hypothetical protein n=1 Tax=Actinoallomurus rhizosphaericola TaxID=2952536 RepID=UPI002091AF15|nr:hypothetical protein [Actinoallomurus rhizosphaericola]MCO5994788.1 hypothetical protein [Actinoallomurus rhizosphaericola]